MLRLLDGGKGVGHEIVARELRRRVLIVDDEPVIRSFLAEGLADAGYQVITARDGADALDCVRQYEPDVVLLDLVMPVLDGWAFLKERCLQPALAAVPVLVFSAGGTEGLRDAAELRANAVLSKPLDLEVLSSVLDHLLRDARTARQDASRPVPGTAAEAFTSTQRPVGTCPICGHATSAEVDQSLPARSRIRTIHAARLAHILSHSAAEIALVPLRTRLLQLPAGRRRILADWVFRELREDWGDYDRRGVHTIDEALNSPAMHQLWLEAGSCFFPKCRHEP